MDHGALVANWHAAPDRKGAGEEFYDKRLNLEDVFDPGPVQEPDDFRYTWSQFYQHFMSIFFQY